jgi:serine phosphatase RsbU (regulator of sigma subunit)
MALCFIFNVLAANAVAEPTIVKEKQMQPFSAEDLRAFDLSRYNIQGDAYWDESNEYFVLTRPERMQTGRIFLTSPFEMSAWVAEFEIRIWEGGGLQGGADGITFAFVRSYNYPEQRVRGSSLDFGGGGYGVEFDTYPLENPGDPQGHHIGLLKDDAYNHLATVVIPGGFRDNVWHHILIVFTNGSITVYYDGKEVISSYSIPNYTAFTGYFGFTAATGHGYEWHAVRNIRMAMYPSNGALVSGLITDNAGQPIPDVSVRLEQDGSDVVQTQTDASGDYQMDVYPVHGSCDLSATAGDLGDWQLGIPLREREHRQLDITLREAISISGAVLASDDASPQVNVLVQAVTISRGPQFATAALSDEEGKYRFINLKPGQYQIRCRVPGSDVYYGEEKNIAPTLQVERGKTLKNINFHLALSEKVTRKADELPAASPTTIPSLKPLVEARTYTAKDGVTPMQSAVADAQGYTWYGPVDARSTTFYRFDGKRFTVDSTIGSGWKKCARDNEGKVWIGGDNGLVRLWNGKVQKHYTVQDGLPSNRTRAIQADKNEGVWVMTIGGISYIYKENGLYRMLLVVDSIFHDPSGMEIDSEGGIWWWEKRSSNTTIIHRLIKAPQGISEVQKIQLPSQVNSAGPVGEGLLLKMANGPLIYCRTDGIAQALDSRLSRYLGADARDRLYFAAEVEDGLMKIIRDASDSEGNFGYPASSMRFEFPMKLSKGYDLYKVKDEMWVSDWVSDKPVFVIRDDTILPAEDLYPFDLVGSRFDMTDDETAWALKWGKREAIELHFPEGMQYEICELDINGLFPVQYNRETERYYFICNPSFTSPEGVESHQLVSYQNQEWKELLKLKSYWFRTDVQGNTWIADSQEDLTRLVCITTDGDLEQQSIKFQAFFPDDRGGCYLLDSAGTLMLYRRGELTTYPLPDIKDIRNIAALFTGSVYIQTEGASYRWTSESLDQLTMKDGLPADRVDRIWKSSSNLFFESAGQIGWIEDDGIISLVDTVRYPQLRGLTYAQQDETGRMFFHRSPIEGTIQEIWMLEGETLGKLPLPDSAEWLGFIFENDEVVLATSDTKIYRYDQEHQQFYTLKDVGEFIGFIWDAYIMEGNLVVSGWGKHFLKIDLKNAPPTFPVLSFQTISIDKEEVDEQSRYTLDPDSLLKASYVGIEKLNQTNVFYQTRLVGLDDEWSEPTKNESIEFRNLPSGGYRLEVRCKGEPGLWGKPIGFDFEVMLPAFYKRTGFTIGLIVISGVSLSGFIVLAAQRWRLSRAERLRLQHELEDAREMQVGLLPEKAPSLEGFDIAGLSYPAREVGGDFFDYISLAEGKIGIAVADVSGKGLKGAMNAVMANSMLHEVAKDRASCGEILTALNVDLHPRMQRHTFTAFGFAIVHRTGETLEWACAGQPYPLIKRGEQVFEFTSDGGLPLGIMPDVAYADSELELHTGDIVIFYTDGVIEAENEAEEMYGTERLEKIIAHVNPTMNASEVVNAILRDINIFVGTAERYDDITIVVVKKI